MPSIRFFALPSETVRLLQASHANANGPMPERAISDGGGVPCRHCLHNVAAGEPYLILAYRPFATLQPYAECGPIFLHAQECQRYPEIGQIPPMLTSARYILRGYNDAERIIYGTGQVVPTDEIHQYAQQLFARTDVAYIHVRSAANNCFQCRIERT